MFYLKIISFSSLKTYLNLKNIKNCFIIGDFNINILDKDVISQESQNNFLGRGYIDYLYKTTQPFNTFCGGTCINILYKSNYIDP